MEWYVNFSCERRDVFETLYSEANKMAQTKLPELAAAAQSATSQEEAVELAQAGDRFLYQLRAACATLVGLVGSTIEPGGSIEVNLAANTHKIEIGLYDRTHGVDPDNPADHPTPVRSNQTDNEALAWAKPDGSA